MRKIILLVVVLMVPIAMVQLTAQNLEMPESESSSKISDQDLLLFSEAYDSVQELQQDLNKEIGKLVDESELGQARFQEIYQSHLTENKEGLSDVSSGEEEQFSELMQEINTVQSGRQESMIEAIDKSGLSLDKFNNIAKQINENPSVYQRYMEVSSN